MNFDRWGGHEYIGARGVRDVTAFFTEFSVNLKLPQKCLFFNFLIFKNFLILKNVYKERCMNKNYLLSIYYTLYCQDLCSVLGYNGKCMYMCEDLKRYLQD